MECQELVKTWYSESQQIFFSIFKKSLQKEFTQSCPDMLASVVQNKSHSTIQKKIYMLQDMLEYVWLLAFLEKEGFITPKV